MKRYLLFAGNFYYPNGGAEDFVKDFDNFDEALEYLNKGNHDEHFFYNEQVWCNIMDTHDGTIKKYSTSYLSKNSSDDIPFTYDGSETANELRNDSCASPEDPHKT